LWDGQTIVLGNVPANSFANRKDVGTEQSERDTAIVVFITATIVDSAGNRVHTDDEMPFAQAGPPPQPY
jgi:hypothetical protein